MTLGEQLDLPCGVTLKNRMVKAAMSDSLGDGQGNPTPEQMRLYERWAEGGAALTIIGEAQVTPHFPEKPGNLVLMAESNIADLKKLAEHGSSNNTHIWPQLGHAGALAHGPISDPKGPSPLDVEGLTCQGMTTDDIAALPAHYAKAAFLAKDCGFTGVQIHAGHGFLFSQFLSPLFNHRTDAYGGDVARRFRIIGKTIDAVRRAVGPAFPIGIKINSTDQLEGGLTQDDALEVVRLLNDTSVDLIDVSGGTYFPGAPSSSDAKSKGGPYFADFAKRAKALTSVPIMLTGGITSRQEAEAVVAEGVADCIGLARLMVMNPDLPNAWLNGDDARHPLPRFSETPPPGGITAWYSMRLTALGEDKEDTFDLTLKNALKAYDARDTARCITWKERFG